METIGRSLHSFDALPLIGHQVAADAKQVESAGASAASAGARSESSIRALSVLLAVAVALLPSIPVLTFYLPARIKDGRCRPLAEPVRRLGITPRLLGDGSRSRQ